MLILLFRQNYPDKRCGSAFFIYYTISSVNVELDIKKDFFVTVKWIGVGAGRESVIAL